MFAQEFISVWETDENREIALPLVDNGTYDFTVDWGDGFSDHIVTYRSSKYYHVYEKEGRYTITISGEIEGWSFGQSRVLNMAYKLREVSQWGSLKLGHTNSQFQFAKNLVITATDSPSLANTLTLYKTFSGAYALTAGIANWDTSTIINMDATFLNAVNFNEDLDGWDTSKVISMKSTFRGATHFNGDIASWDTANVEDFSGFAAGALQFNSNISQWDTARVRSLASMFHQARQFNGDISGWDTSNVYNLNDTFNDAQRFDSDISAWNVSKVRYMSDTFKNAQAFNQNISAWAVDEVEYMHNIFDETRAFAYQDEIATEWSQKTQAYYRAYPKFVFKTHRIHYYE